MSNSAVTFSANAGNNRSPVVKGDPGQVLDSATSRAPKVASYELFQTTVSDLKTTRRRVLHESAGHFIGPMPVEEFLDEFMPWNENVDAAYKKVVPPQSRIDRLKTLPQCSEADSYTAFVSGLQVSVNLS